MIHGYKRTKKQKSQQEIKDEDQLSQKINTKLADFFSLPRTNVNPLQLPTLLEFTSLLMQLCSDIPTIFNFRREIIKLHIKDKSVQQVGAILGGQIKLTTKLIQSDPKSYTIWSYRQWLVVSLFKVNSIIIKTEKQLCRMLLLKDQKNFHVWNYRNWLNSIQLFIDDQILFTQQKIKSNPFNFSPYHFRSKFICIKYSKRLKQLPHESSNRQIIQFGMPKSFLQSEFQCVKTAIFLNPNEEAPWLFYNWLLSQLVPAFIVGQQIQENRTVMYLNMKVSDFSLLINGDYGQLRGKSGKMNSEVWEGNTIKTHLNVKSNLQHYQEIKLQNNGKLFLGNQDHKNWIVENIKLILNRQLSFLTQVLESEEDNCRFASLQQTYIYKLLLQCGSSQSEFNEIVDKGLQSLKAISDESKGHKYVLKQLAYWQRLRKGPLNKVETWLKSYYDQ